MASFLAMLYMFTNSMWLVKSPQLSLRQYFLACTNSDDSVAKDDSPDCDSLVITILNENRNSRIR